MPQSFDEYREQRKKERFRNSKTAKVIRQLKHKGMSNEEIRLYGPRMLKQMKAEEEKPENNPKYSVFRRAATLARQRQLEEEHGQEDDGRDESI